MHVKTVTKKLNLRLDTTLSSWKRFGVYMCYKLVYLKDSNAASH